MLLRQELEKLRSRIQALESQIKREEAEAMSAHVTSTDDSLKAQAALEKEGERDGRGEEEKLNPARARRDTAASVIQRRWRKHRERVGNRPPPQTKMEGNLPHHIFMVTFLSSLSEGCSVVAVGVQRPPAQRDTAH